jgi:hypothetical protein
MNPYISKHHPWPLESLSTSSIITTDLWFIKSGHLISNTMVNKTDIDQISFFAAESRPYGRSYGNWTVKWWKWILSIPKSASPAVDPDGRYAYRKQRSNEVWFLAGKLGDDNTNLPTRYCTIPHGRSLLFPIINCESNQLENPELRSLHDIIEKVKNDEDTIIEKECYVDGKSIPAQRVTSDPNIFELTLHEDNLFGVKRGGNTYASADGYWVFLQPLPLGHHTISFRGSCEYGRLISGANYHLKIDKL